MRSRPRVALLGVAALVLTACGAAGPAEVAQCDGEIPEDTTVTVFAHEGAEAGVYTEALAQFNETRGAELGVTADLTLIPEGQYTDQIKSAAAAGDIPDVVDFDGPTMANFAWARALKPMGTCASEDLRSRLLPSIVEQGTYAGELYGIGSFDSGLGLWSWRSVLDEVGARVPSGYQDAWTVDEFEQILRDLQDAGYDNPLDLKFWYGSQGEWFSYAFAPILWSAGAGLVETEGEATAEGVLNSPEAVEALSTFQTWVDDGLVDRDAVDDSNFLEKRAPISWTGHWMYAPYKEAAGDDLVLLPLPDFGNGSRTGMGSWAWALGNSDTDPDAAMAVIDYMVSDDVILNITEVNGAIPATTSAISKSDLHTEGGALRLFVEQLQAAPDAAHPRPVTPAYPTITSTFASSLDDIIQGAPVDVTLDEAVTSINEDIDYSAGYPEPEITEPSSSEGSSS
jgi:multiple sugar transport system substrate-binding protein